MNRLLLVLFSLMFVACSNGSDEAPDSSGALLSPNAGVSNVSSTNSGSTGTSMPSQSLPAQTTLCSRWTLEVACESVDNLENGETTGTSFPAIEVYSLKRENGLWKWTYFSGAKESDSRVFVSDQPFLPDALAGLPTNVRYYERQQPNGVQCRDIYRCAE